MIIKAFIPPVGSFFFSCYSGWKTIKVNLPQDSLLTRSEWNLNAAKSLLVFACGKVQISLVVSTEKPSAEVVTKAVSAAQRRLVSGQSFNCSGRLSSAVCAENRAYSGRETHVFWDRVTPRRIMTFVKPFEAFFWVFFCFSSNQSEHLIEKMISSGALTEGPHKTFTFLKENA